MTDETREKLKDIVAKKPLQTAILTTPDYDRGFDQGKKECRNDVIDEIKQAYLKWVETGDPIPFSVRLEALKKNG